MDKASTVDKSAGIPSKHNFGHKKAGATWGKSRCSRRG
jgi:hypothetical protein